MGNGSSLYLTEELLNEYSMLTYLSKSEILHLYKILGNFENTSYRYPPEKLEEVFPQLKFNPFRDRIYRVFSSLRDNRLSFEDILDLCSVMSEKCPDKVKAAWAFKIFDFDEDNAVGERDLMTVIDRLTGAKNQIGQDEKKDIIKVLLDEMALESNGSIGPLEFQHAVGKMSEFPHSFCFRF